MLPLENGALHSLLLLMLKQAHKHQVCLLGDKKKGEKKLHLNLNSSDLICAGVSLVSSYKIST